MPEQETETKPTTTRPNDFFTEFMFGRPMPRKQEQTESQKEIAQEEKEAQPASGASNSQLPFTYEQMEHMMKLAESLGPTLQKLTPYFKMIQHFFTANKGK